MIVLYYILLLAFAAFSYVLIDPNLTLVTSPLWEAFRNWAVNIGYHNTNISSLAYLVFVALFFISHFLFVKYYKKVSLTYLLVSISFLTIFSYPFLSHDVFSYIFDAKIVTFYHYNPYEVMPGFFYDDPWLRFMHWTDRRYPYGPVFLPLTLIPSFLGMAKFLPTLLLFKGLYVFFYIVTARLLNKLNKKWAIIFATHPFILFEGLVNVHNDFIAVALGLVGIYYMNKKGYLAKLFFLLSAGIKYTTLPLIILSKKKSIYTHISFLLTVGILLYASFTLAIQPWYFLPLFIFLPFYEKLLQRLHIFFFGLLVSYYPYIKAAGWGQKETIIAKDNIVYVFTALNLIYLVYLKRKFLRR